MTIDNTGTISLSTDEEQNYISIDNEDYFLVNLTKKGASSNLFILRDPNEETEDRVIKICKSSYTKWKASKHSNDKRLRRFMREIRAFNIAKKAKCVNVIHFYRSGKLEIGGGLYPFIILEKAENDLANHLEANNFGFTINQKLLICVDILKGVKQLHDLKIYHRDIKHDNILKVDGEFKIGDLGLVDFQDEDADIDWINEKIGPYAWLSPEATNKALTKDKNIGNLFDCEINSASDIFQLGKLFWYIFQGNLPLGQITFADARFADQEIFDIIFLMLKHNQAERPDVKRLNEMFDPIKLRLVV